MTGFLPKYQLETQIKSYDVDAFGNLSLPRLFLFFQEIANRHATNLEWGYEYLHSIQKFWVLSRICVEISYLPKEHDTVSVETWSRGAEGFLAYRDFELKMNNNVCISACSSWIVLDAVTHRPCKIEQLGKAIPGITDSAMPYPSEKLPKPGAVDYSKFREIRFSDIDINHHVNNARYIEILMDAMYSDLAGEKKIKSLDIQYLQESKINDTLEIRVEKIDKTNYLISVERTSDKKEICRARIGMIS